MGRCAHKILSIWLGAAMVLLVPSAVRGQAGSAATGSPQITNLADLSLEELMNIEVTSVSKTKERIADAPAAITAITQEDIKRSGLREIPEILRLVPGLFVQRGNHSTGTSISARGFANTFADKLLVLQDGRALYTPLFSGVYWNITDYPIDDLDRIEVIRGPGATLWGANAVDGVINITTKSARDTQGALVDSRVGTDGSSVAARYGAKVGPDTFYRVYAKGRHFSDMKYAADPIGNENRLKDARLGFRADRYSSDTDTLTVQGDLFYETNSNNNFTGVFIPNYSANHRNGANLLARWTHVESAQSDTSLQVYWDRLNTSEALASYHLNTFDVDLQRRFLLSSRHEMMYGLTARLQMEDVGTSFLERPLVSPAVRNTHLFGGFVQDTITVAPEKVKLIVGSKFEHNSLAGFDVQPTARILWTPNETSTLWAAVSRAVRTPSRFQADTDLTGRIPIGPGQFAAFHIGSERPGNETLVAYEIGHRRQIRKNVSIDLSAFFNRYDDLIDYLSLPPTFAGNPPQLVVSQTIDNVRSAKTAGVELEARWQLQDRWRLGASYSFLQMFVHDKAANVLVPAAVIERSSPRNMAQLHSNYDVTPTLQFNTSAYYVEGTSGANVVQSPGPDPSSYVRLDANLAWTLKRRLELSAGIQNAAQQRHFESPFSGRASAQIERAGYCNVTWHF